MSAPRRPRRQGVVYGPVRTRHQADGATLVGRLIGMVVVLGALVALLVGALAVIGGGGAPQASPTATPLPTPSPGATASPTATPLQTPTPVPSPSPSPTPFPVVLEEGPGKITFATDYSSSTLQLINKTVDFGPTGPIAWQANIGTPVGTDSIDITVSLVDVSNGSETVVHTETTAATNASASVFLRHSRVQKLVSGAGVYVMRYTHNGTVVAEGYFRVTA
jgi:hypothetical protein